MFRVISGNFYHANGYRLIYEKKKMKKEKKTTVEQLYLASMTMHVFLLCNIIHEGQV